MSSRKYVLKKDIKPIVIKCATKFPIISTSPINDSRIKLSLTKNSPLNISIRHPRNQRVTKSLNNYQKIKNSKASCLKKKIIFNTEVINSKNHQIPNYNIRYLKESLEEIEDKNNIETPSDSQQISNNIQNTGKLIANQYEDYLLYTFKNHYKYKNQRSLTPAVRNHIIKFEFTKEEDDSPKSIENFLKTRKIF